MVAEPLTCILQSDCLVANLPYCLASCLLIASEVVEQLTGLFLLHPNVSQPPPTLSSLLIYNPYHPHGLIPSNCFCQGSPNHHHPGSFFEQRLFMGNWLNSEPIFLCHDKD